MDDTLLSVEKNTGVGFNKYKLLNVNLKLNHHYYKFTSFGERVLATSQKKISDCYSTILLQIACRNIPTVMIQEV